MRTFEILDLRFAVPFLLLLTSRLSAQCPFDWTPIDQPSGRVNAVTKWDPDASGPIPESLFVGGEFTAIGSMPANHIASWNGQSWQLLGTGTAGDIFALKTFNGTLIAGGGISSAGGIPAQGVARWTGVNWEPLGGGMPYGYVYALTTFNGELIAGGNFTYANSYPNGPLVHHIARWDGESWHSLGGGMSGGVLTRVLALAVFQGELIAGGDFTAAGGVPASYIARWNGSVWQPLGSGMSGTAPRVLALAVYNGELIAGGMFEFAGGVSVQFIARWNGTSWQAVGGPMSNQVRALALSGGDLIAGGAFNLANGVYSPKVARWDGAVWQALGSGLPPPGAYSLSEFRGEPIAGGYHFLSRYGPAIPRGDMNFDQAVTLDDLPLFVDALLDPSNLSTCQSYAANANADVHPDGAAKIDALDIPAFTACLLAGCP